MRNAILAKSPYTIDGEVREITLAKHADDVLRASDLMFGQPDRPTRLARQWLRFFKLPPEVFDAFLHNLRLAALFHDLGKANDGFQAMVRGKGQQAIRHEHLSGLMLWLPPMREWLESLAGFGVDPEVVVSAVVSHHLKTDGSRLAQPLHEAARAIQVYAASKDVERVLNTAAALFGVEPTTIAACDGTWAFKRQIDVYRRRLRDDLDDFDYGLDNDDRRRRLLLAVKAALLAVDSAGSAATRTDKDLKCWLQSAFSIAPLTPDDIEEKVVEPRVAELKRAGRWRGNFHDFQLGATELGPRALLLAGCGSGKTLAAWKWAAAQLAHQEASRVLFLYPTRATATEGFRDYVSWAGPEEAALVSGTARYDLQGLFENPGSGGDPRSGGDYAVEERLFALAYWERRVFSATVDSFLACMTNRYAALCLLPLLVDSLVVVDEVHSFSPSMFKALERLLGEFDVPVLCMTASLPEHSIVVLNKDRGLDMFPPNPSNFPDLAKQTEADRYRVRWTTDIEAYSLATGALSRGKRVLWVVNTVARCQQIARRLRGNHKLGGSVLCYHSRFTLEHRKKRHESVIAAFRQQDRPFILVTTQVCEMSLDLDADVLITELAPVPSLIQRMGRCCRVPIPPVDRRGDVYVYPPEGFPPDGFRPYEQAELEQGAAFTEWLAGREPVSQADLADRLRALPIDEWLFPGRFSAFPDSGPYAVSREDPFREDDGYVVDAVLDRDVEAWQDLRRRGEPAEGYVVPVPRRLTERDVRLGGFLRRACVRRYDEFLGFQEEVPPRA